MSSPLFDWFVPCPRGLEAPLAAELSEIGERHVASAPLSGGHSSASNAGQSAVSPGDDC